MSSLTPANSPAMHSQFECPLSLEPLTSQDAAVISCGHHFTQQGIYEYLNSSFSGAVPTISDLFTESVQDRLQTKVVNCPLCAKRIRSVSDDPQFRETIGTIEMLSSISIPSSVVASAAASAAAASSALVPSEALSTAAASSAAPSPLTIHLLTITDKKYTFQVFKHEKVSSIWKKIIEHDIANKNYIITVVNSKSIFPWEPISTYVPTGENELKVCLVLRLGKTSMPKAINDLAKSVLGPTASADDIHNLSASLYAKAIDASLQ